MVGRGLTGVVLWLDMKLDELMGTMEVKKRKIIPPGGRKMDGVVRLKSTTDRARTLFFHGNGDGKPVCNIPKLAEMSGASPKTLERWLPVWQREARELAVRGGAATRGLGALVSLEDITLHRKTLNHLANELQRLSAVLPGLSVMSDVYQDALRMLLTSFKQWSSMVGCDDLAKLNLTIQIEQIKRAARAPGKDDTQERNVSGFNFDAVPVAALPTSREDT